MKNERKNEKKKNERKMKKKCILECVSQKRVIYIQVNWEWNIRSNTRAIWYPCLPSHISHHIYQLGQSDFQYLCLPSSQIGESGFICTLVTPFLSPYQK